MKPATLMVGADPYRNLTNPHDHAVIAWTDASGASHTAVADARCLAHKLEDARVSRRPVKYRNRRNYEGYYWCAGSGESVWYESMTEYSVLMELDHTHRPAQVAAQPLCILFADGSRHYPDYFVLHRSGRRFLYDVRPAGLVDDKAETQFARTREVCGRIGWGYEVLHGVTGAQRHNLEWLAGYRHPYTAPEPRARSLILDATREPISLSRLAGALDPELPARHLPGIYHLLWNRDLAYSTDAPLGWHTLVERSSRG